MGTGPANVELGMNVVGQHEASTAHRARHRELRGREGLGRHGKLGRFGGERGESRRVGERDGDDERTVLEVPSRGGAIEGVRELQPLADDLVALSERSDAVGGRARAEDLERIGEGSDENAARSCATRATEHADDARVVGGELLVVPVDDQRPGAVRTTHLGDERADILSSHREFPVMSELAEARVEELEIVPDARDSNASMGGRHGKDRVAKVGAEHREVLDVERPRSGRDSEPKTAPFGDRGLDGGVIVR